MNIKVCIAGATGWTGGCIAKSILNGKVSGFQITGAVARKTAGQDLGKALGLTESGITIKGNLREALTKDTEVLIDYTNPTAVKENVLNALESGVSVVIGTSGLTAGDYGEIEKFAQKQSKGVIAAGNFSITAALVKHFSLIASDYIPHWEVIDYADGDKVDAPSGTTRELAEALGNRNENRLVRPIDEIIGPKESRGAQVAGTPVHSIRLPSYMISFETLFGLPNERLTIRHDAGAGAEPYVNGTLLAVKKATEITGLIRGLDTLLFRG